MDTLGYADPANQHEPWQSMTSLPAHFSTGSELPNIAPLSNEALEASLPPQSLMLMNDISNLMATITMAMSQGPSTPSYILAQTFQPLIHMAVGLQLSTLQGGGGGAASPMNQMMLPAPGTEYYQHGATGIADLNPEKDVEEEYVPKAAAGKKRKGEGRQQQQASNREPRRRKTSSRFSDFVNIDDV